MKNRYKNLNDDYRQLKSKLLLQLIGTAIISLVIIFAFYILVWKGNGGNWLVSVIQQLFYLSYDDAVNIYQKVFVNNQIIIFVIAVITVLSFLLFVFIKRFTEYFRAINQGIDALLDDNGSFEILLPPEMSATERKLNTVKQTLKQRELGVKLAEQRKNDLVMYLAHDIKTPLTSVIGYLSLLDEAPDMPAEQKAKYVHITLDKAYRLEKMINEFFEITRYNFQQISLSKENIDLYYMLVQLVDEISPVLLKNENTVVLDADENLILYGDPDKLARVFNNVLKNAAAYSYKSTEIVVTAKMVEQAVVITFKNQGATIPQDKLITIFEKFYRLNEARNSDTGGSGLGLAIAKEIVTLHDGTITATSEREMIVFEITLPILT